MRLVAVLLLLSACVGGRAVPTSETDRPDPPEDTAPEPVISDLDVDVHDEVHTVLVVEWRQSVAAESARVEYAFEGESASTPPRARAAGNQEQVVLGLPADTDVTIQVVLEVGGEEIRSEALIEETDSLPSGLEDAELRVWNPDAADAAPWFLGSIDVGNHWYQGPFRLFVLDRQGRVVWYHVVPDSKCSMFARVARDGTHVIFDATTTYTYDPNLVPSVTRLTLDHAYEEKLELPGLIYTYEELDDGTILYDPSESWYDSRLVARRPDGTDQEIWDCPSWIARIGSPSSYCSANTINWYPERGTVLWSMYQSDTVVEVDLTTGEVVHQWGQLPGSAPVEPAEANFDLQHFPNFTSDGTLLVSTHVPREIQQQRAHEYTIHEATGALTQVWTYGAGVEEYANYAGEATRLGNGNTLINYGTDGVIREVTPAGEVAWEVAWPGHLLGHNTPLYDLYALIEGPE